MDIGPYGGEVTIHLDAGGDHWVKPSEFTISLNGKNIPFTYREPGWYVDDNGDDDPTSPYLLVTFNVPPNDIYSERTLNFNFNPIPYMTGTTLTVKQEPKLDPDGSMIPICESITYAQNTDKMEYSIFTGGSTIYSGNAYRYPDSDGDAVVEVNDILSDHLKNHISFTEGIQEMDGFFRMFEIGSAGVSGYKIVEVYNAWEKPK